MFASKKTTIRLNSLILFSGLLCVSPLQAQKTDTQHQSEQPLAGENASGSENRRIERLGDAEVDEWEMDLSLYDVTAVAVPDYDVVVLPDAEQNQALKELLSSMAQNPGDTAVAERLDTLLSDVLNQASELIDTDSIAQAEQLLSVVQSIDPDLAGFTGTLSRLKSVKAAAEWVNRGHSALTSQRILEPDNDNALYFFSQALKNDPGNTEAQLGLAGVQEALTERALLSAEDLDYESAQQWLLAAATIQQDQRVVENAYFEVAKIEQQHAIDLEFKVREALRAGKFTLADFYIIDLIAMGDQEPRVELLRSLLSEARFYGGLKPGQVVRDELLQTGGYGPEVVVIKAGSFLMGSNNGPDNEQPQHRVSIAHGFALGVKELSVAEFRLFIDSSGYRTTAERVGKSSVYDETAGRLTHRKGVNWAYDYTGGQADEDLPVLHVNLLDARAYVQWLSRETKKTYRLPTEAEYEYVARAGGNGTYWWGEGTPGEVVENLTGDRDKSPGYRQWTTFFKKYGDGHWGPAPSGAVNSSHLTHPMGVYDIAGNVSEWVQDCWHHNYVKAPVDGSAWVNPGCDRHVVRGGYWASSPTQCRAAFRISAKAETYGPVVGIRVARDL